MQESSIVERTRNRWRGILGAIGVDDRLLTGKHVACPLCGGKDRFRFDDKDGSGSWLCNRCGAGYGIHLVQKVMGIDFCGAVTAVEKIVGTVAIRRKEARETKTDFSAWKSAGKISGVVEKYLANRRVMAEWLEDVRGGKWEMVALVRGCAGQPCQIHRTILEQRDGEIRVKRRLFAPGQLAVGAAVRLSNYHDTLGIAEGIETAISASCLFRVPCWAALNAGQLEKWVPPEDVSEVIIFGDNDAAGDQPSFAGQRASYNLAHRLSRDGWKVEVRIPDTAGHDWNDVLVGG